MDSLEVYSILLTQYVKNGNQINKQFVQLAYKLLNELILKNIQIEPNWGPFQELVDAFLCSVADIKNTDESFMQAFKYFYLQQRHDKAAGCIYRRCQRIISEINRFKLQTEIISSQQVIQKMQKLVKYLAICLSTCNLSVDRKVVWGYNVQGANEVIIQQLLQYENQLVFEGAEDRYEINQKQYQLNQLDNKIRQQMHQHHSNIYEVYNYDEILQQFIYYQSIMELMGAVPGATVKGQYNRTNNTFSKPGGVSITLQNTYLTDCRTALSLKPFEVFNSLLNQGNIDQALTLMKAFGFSCALVIQHLVKQIILLMDKMSQSNTQNTLNKHYKLSFNQNVNIPGLNNELNRRSKYLCGESEGYRTSDSKELEDFLLLLTQLRWFIEAKTSDTFIRSNQLNGQSTYLQFSDTFEGEVLLAAAITCRGLPQARSAAVFHDFSSLLRIDPAGIFMEATPAVQERYQQFVIIYDIDFLRQVFRLPTIALPSTTEGQINAPGGATVNNKNVNTFNNQIQRPQIKQVQAKPRIVSQYGQAQLHNYNPSNARKQNDLTTDDLATEGTRTKAKFNADITGGRRIGGGIQYQKEGSVNPLLQPTVQGNKPQVNQFNRQDTRYQRQNLQQQQKQPTVQYNANHFDQSLKNIENKLVNMGINLNSAAPQSILKKSGMGSGVRKSVGFAQD